jgi:hypothetical protein
MFTARPSAFTRDASAIRHAAAARTGRRTAFIADVAAFTAPAAVKNSL